MTTRPTHQQRASQASRRLSAAVGSIAFFVAAPVTIGGVVPWLLTDWHAGESFPARTAAQLLGALMIAAGALVLVHSFVRFVVEGLGTPAPLAPTTQLVIGGPYRFVRNPMYVAVIVAVIGQALLLGRPVLLTYAAAIGSAMAAFVRGYEEPALARQFTDQYECYRRAVRRWWPALHPWDPAGRRDRTRR